MDKRLNVLIQRMDETLVSHPAFRTDREARENVVKAVDLFYRRNDGDIVDALRDVLHRDPEVSYITAAELYLQMNEPDFAGFEYEFFKVDNDLYIQVAGIQEAITGNNWMLPSTVEYVGAMLGIYNVDKFIALIRNELGAKCARIDNAKYPEYSAYRFFTDEWVEKCIREFPEHLYIEDAEDVLKWYANGTFDYVPYIGRWYTE